MTEQNVITAEQVAAARSRRVSLIETFANRLGLEPDKMMATLKATAFRVRGGEVTNEQMAALLVVANEHGLNPFTKEIYAYPDKQGGIVPVVGVDGWLKIINEHPQFNGMDFRESDEIATLEGSKPCPKWIECTIHRKDRAHPTVIREYLDEVYRPPFIKDGRAIDGPWQTHTKRFLRHKTIIQAARAAFSFAGIYDPDEADRVLAAEDAIDVTPVKMSPKRLREIVDGMLAAVKADNAVELQKVWTSMNQDEQLHVWGTLRSWERTAIKKLQSGVKALPEGIDLDAWSVEALNATKDADGYLATWKAVQDAYAERDMLVPPDIETVAMDRKQVLAVP